MRASRETRRQPAAAWICGPSEFGYSEPSNLWNRGGALLMVMLTVASPC